MPKVGMEPMRRQQLIAAPQNVCADSSALGARPLI